MAIGKIGTSMPEPIPGFRALDGCHCVTSSLARVYGTITFILEHPKEIEAYLEDQDRRYEEFKASHPLPADIIERFERGSAKGRRSEVEFSFPSGCLLEPEIGRGLRRREGNRFSRYRRDNFRRYFG